MASGHSEDAKDSDSTPEEVQKEVPSSVFINHDCKTGHDIDLLRAFVPGESFRKRISRFLRRLSYLDQTSALSREVFRSDTAMRREISRHISFYSSTIHPFSKLRFLWECMMIVTFAVAFVMLPYDVIFLYHQDEYYTLSWFHLIVLAVDLICLVDICFSIRTGYYDKKRQNVVLEPRKIANRYVIMWFWIDLISSAPDPLFSRYIVPQNASAYSLIDCLHRKEMHFGCFWDGWKVLSILKMFRLRTFLRYISNVYKRYGIRRNVMKFTTIATVVMVSLHWTSCMMFLVARSVQGTDPDLVDPQSWTKKVDLWSEPSLTLVVHRYLECLFRTLYTVGLVTHPIDQFMTMEDILMALVATIFGYVLKIYVLAELLIFIRIMFSSTSMYYEHRHELQNYIRHERHSPELETRMMSFYDHRVANRYSRKAMIDMATGGQFHPSIRDEVCGTLVAGVSIFREAMPQEVLRKLLLALKYQLFLKGDLVVNASEGSDGAKMVFVIRGTVAIYTANWREVLHLEDGEHFGEYQLLLDADYMKYSHIIAVETSEVYVLPKAAFTELLSQYPAVQEQLLALARERYEALVAIERNVVLETIAEAETIRRTNFYQ